MVLSMMGFAGNDTLIKSLGGALSTGQIMCMRGAVLTLLIGFLIWQQKLLHTIRDVLTPLIALRTLFELGATLAFLSVLTLLPLANVYAILQALPLLVTLGAAWVFKEAIGWRRWLAIGIGFLGVLIIIRPGMHGFNSASLLIVLSVVFAAGRDLITRALPKNLPSLLISGTTALIISLFGLILTTASKQWVTVSWHQLQVLVGAAAFLFFGYHFIIMAMRTGDVAYVVPYRYTSLIWAIVLGYVVFAEIPDGYTLLGSTIVIAMGLFKMYREIKIGQRKGNAPSV